MAAASHDTTLTGADAVDDLFHYGKKGMQWGVVNEEDGTSAPSGTRPVKQTEADHKADPDGPDRRAQIKKAALIAGGVALVAGASYGAYKLNQSGGLKNVTDAAVEAKKVLQPPTDIIHLARARNKGLKFHSTGNTPDFFTIFDNFGLNGDVGVGFFAKGADGSVASRFLDPLKRSDFAGRPISHDVVVPKSMATGMSSSEDVLEKVWPKIKDSYQKFWDESLVAKHSDQEEGGIDMSDMETTAKRGADAVDDLFHYGTKGMKWGVRKYEKAQGRADKAQADADKWQTRSDNRQGKLGQRNFKSEAVLRQKVADKAQAKADKKGDKVDAKWQKSIYSMPGAVAVHNSMADYCNARIGGLNDKYPSANLHKTPYDEATQKYFDETMALQTAGYNHAVKEVHGQSPTGRRKAVYVADENGERIEVVASDSVKHSEETEPALVVLLKTSADGHILEFNQAEQEVAHSGDADDFLAHFGVKGMKWGVRNDDKSGSGGSAPKERGKLKRGATKAAIALDAGHNVIKKGEEKLIFLPVAKRDKAAGATQGRMLGEAAALNRDPRFKGKDLKRDAKLADEYHKELTKKAVDIYKEELGQVRAEALAEFVAGVYDYKQSRVTVTAPSNKIRHAEDSDELLMVLDFDINETGHVVDCALNTEDLKHYGVKGMKWGVTTVDKASSPTLTREKKALRNTKDVTVTQRKAGTYVKTKGGKRQKATDDAVKAAAARQKAKKSTTDALTNDELKAAVERMNLEQQYAKLDAKTKRRGQGFVSLLFQNADARSAAADLAKRVNETNS